MLWLLHTIGRAVSEIRYTKQELELRMSEEELFESMRRRLETMQAALRRRRTWRKNKTEGVLITVLETLWEIDERMGIAYALSHRLDVAPDADEKTVRQTKTHNVLAGIYGAELQTGYRILRRMYDAMAGSRLLEPSEVTESTREGAIREMNQRDRDNPVMVWAHAAHCPESVDHIAPKPRGRHVCPKTWEEWDL
jgi:hypothetical protein